MVEQDNAPNWQEMDKAISIIKRDLVYRYAPLAEFDKDGTLTRTDLEDIYIKLRKVALEHARIEN